MKKMSYVSAIDAVLSGAPIEGEVKERIEALRESLVKRASRKPTGPSKAQIARAELAERLFGAMESGVAYSSADLAGLLPELEGATPQKITALVKALGERVSATKVKGKAVYSIA